MPDTGIARAAPAPNNLVSIASEYDAFDAGPTYPLLAAGGVPRFEDGEHVFWRGSLTVAALRQKVDGRALVPAWKFAAPSQVWMSDGRILYVCHKFTAGDWKTAWAGTGDAVAAVVDTAIAAAHRHGRVGAGHVRHEWVTSVVLARRLPRIGRSKAVIGVTCIDPWDDALVRLLLMHPDSAVMATLAQRIVSMIAESRRQQSRVALTPEWRSALAQQERSPETTVGQQPFGTGRRITDPFPSLGRGQSMTFSLPGAVKIG